MNDEYFDTVLDTPAGVTDLNLNATYTAPEKMEEPEKKSAK